MEVDYADDSSDNDIILDVINQLADIAHDDNYSFCYIIEQHINKTLKLNIDYKKIHHIVSEYLSGDL